MTTAKDLERALETKYVNFQSEWALLREVTLVDDVIDQAHQDLRAIPWQQQNSPEHKELLDLALGFPWTRRIDILLVRIRGGKIPLERMAIEIKVSRGDFFRDTEEKRRPFEKITHRFAYCTPKDLVKPEEVPAGCGLLEFDGTWVNWKKRAPYKEEPPADMSNWLVSTFARRASHAEAELRRIKRSSKEVL